jgi:glucose/mannose transport system substrate-binding protein
MRCVASVVLLTLVLGLAPGSSAPLWAAEGAPAAPESDTLTFYHWLESPSELAALNALVDLFKAKYPKVTVKAIAAPRRGSVGLYPIVSARTLGSKPPDSFMMHVGYSSQIFFDGGLLSPVDDLWASEKLETVMPAVVRGMSKIDGHYYVIPLNVHRDNLVWYNRQVLTKYGIDPATLTTWEAFFEANKKLHLAGVPYPIQLGKEWTVAHVFECVIASLGTSTYTDWINGKVKKDDPRLLDALKIFKQYLGYVNSDHQSVEWDQAQKRVTRGESAFYIMGDWADGEFKIAGLEYGKDYGAFPVPGTRGVYVATVDAFVRTSKLAEHTNSDRWLKLLASREAQDAFSILKGSIPARTDVVVAKYGAYQQSAIADFKTAKSIYPSLGLAVPQPYKVRFDATVADFARDLDVEKAANGFGDAATEWADKFTRGWSLR